MQEYRRRLRETPGAKACPVCGFQFRPEDTGETCGDAYCRGEMADRLGRIRLQQERRQAKEESAFRKERELRGRMPGEIPATAVLAVLPAQSRPLVPQEPGRRMLLRERLVEIVGTADDDPDGPTGDPAGTGDEDALTRAACTACRGHCCKYGEDHAFIRPATLRRYHREHPELTSAQVVDAYVALVPARSVAGSCVFHGREGCTLPRRMRSDVCNRYVCDDLERVHLAVASAPAPKPPVLAVCFEDGHPARTALLDAGRVRLLDETPPPPVPPA